MNRLIVAHVLTGEAARRIDALRKRFDPKTAAAIDAHLTLAGPFDSEHGADHYVPRIRAVAGQYAPFEITIRGFGSFIPTSLTTFAQLADRTDVVAVHDALVNALRWKERYPYVPHVTITEYLDREDTTRVYEVLGQTTLEVSDTVSKLSLMQKGIDGRWESVRDIPLVG